MADAEALAHKYLARSAGAFWRWSEEDGALVWRDGTTIAFRQEVEYVLSRLVTNGFPPFGAVVVLLAACRSSWHGPAAATKAVVLESLTRSSPCAGDAAGSSPRRFLESFFKNLLETLDGLDAVNALDEGLRTSSKAKAVLAEVVFEPAEIRVQPADAVQILKALRGGFCPETAPDRSYGDLLFGIEVGDVAALRPGLSALDEETLRLRARTGLDRLPRAAALELPDAERVRALVSALRGDQKLSGLARLAQDLMAAVHLPRRVSDLDELPFGGFSDIANRGPLDRLLVSELAQDGTILAARIALNEALYLRRERPPRKPPARRALLIDCGVRLWGVPRLFATAVALALAATADRKSEVLAYRASGTDIDPVDLASREGLVSHLEVLEAAPDPGAALPAFLAAVGHGEAEELVITHEDALADPEFRATLARLDHEAPGLEIGALTVATVSRDGTFRLWSVSPRGQQLIREATLELDDLLEPEPRDAPGKPLVAPPVSRDLPVILSAAPFPFLLACPEHLLRRTFHSPRHGTVAVTQDGRLLHWRDPALGARQISANLPSWPLEWLYVRQDGTVRALFGTLPRHPFRLLSARLDTGECTVLDLDASRSTPLAVWESPGVLYFIHTRTIDGFSLRSGECVSRLEVSPGLVFRGGRFFHDVSGGWHALVSTGLRAKLAPVHLARSLRGKDLVALFERPGRDGPWALTGRGSVLSTVRGGEISLQHGLSPPVSLVGVSHDGNRLAIRGRGDGRAVLDLEIPAVVPELEPQVNLCLSSSEERWLSTDEITRFAVAGEKLSLFGDRGGALVLRQRGMETVWEVAPLILPGISRLQGIPFRPLDSPPGTKYRLSRATFGAGSCAYLDSRGLLHLKSSRPSLPELSLVLTRGPTAMWSSHERLRGPAFFTAGARPFADLYLELREFLRRTT